MKKFTYLFLLSGLLLLAKPVKLSAATAEIAVATIENICIPTISFGAVQHYYPDGTYDLLTDVTIKQEAYHQVKIQLEQIYGLSENIDWEFAEDYTAPEFCGNPGSLVYVFLGEEPTYCVVEIYWQEQILSENCPQPLTLSEDDPELIDKIKDWLDEASAISETGYPVIVVNDFNFDENNIPAPGTYIIRFTVSVNCGPNSPERVFCTRTLTIEESENQGEQPVALCTDITLILDGAGTAILTPEMIDGGSSGGTLTIDKTTFDCYDLGENTVTLTITSPEGLTATCEATVTVTDDLAPDFGKGNKSIRETITEGEVYYLPDLSELFPATDNCGVATYDQFPVPGTEYTVGTTENISLIATDIGGNSTEISVKITLRVAKAKRVKSAEIENSVAETGLKVWPNPFAQHVHFEFIPESSAHARLEIFNTTGVKIATLIDQKVIEQQIYRLSFSPERVSSGLYFYRLQLGETTKSGKIIANPYN